MKFEDLAEGKKYLMDIDFESSPGDDISDDVVLKKNITGLIEVSGFSPSRWGALYDDGNNFQDAFTEVNWALIIMELAKEMSDDPSANSFKLSDKSNFEFTFAINAKSMEEIVSKVQLFFEELYSRTDKRWDEFNKVVKIK
jgi:hypothetical protein